jgi:hypothetical protein
MRLINAGVAAACFAWLLLMVVLPETRRPQQKPPLWDSMHLLGQEGYTLLEPADDCDCPWCEGRPS